jgi:hypothetical protein
MAKKISYSSRNFADYRGDLINFVKQYYPQVLSDYNDASIGSLLIEINAAIGDNLSFLADNRFNETQINYAQERASVLSMARTMGVKIPGKRPSISIVDFSVVVPVFGNSFDAEYCPVIRQGAQVNGAGKVFETMDDIDFANPFTTGGLPNRLVTPNIDSNNMIQNYTITKREIVLNGVSKVFKKIITQDDVKPFLEVLLPENDIISIESVIALDGTNYTSTPTLNQFLDVDNQWFEMQALAEDKVFIEDKTQSTDNASIKPGKYLKVNKRFITEYTDQGFIKLIFGGGSQDIGSLNDFNINTSLTQRIGDFINNYSLGTTHTVGTTLFIKYRRGGGSASNLGPNVLNSLGLVDMIINGSDTSINTKVAKSLTVNNPAPALGGRDEPSVDEVRNLVRYNFASQNRAVGIKDYQSRISLMDGKYGVPFRCGVFEEQNKIKLSVLGLDANGKLTNTSTNTLKENIATYLSDYRMLNDYIEVTDGKIINIGFEIDLFIDKNYPQSQIISQVITDVSSFMDINKFQMGENIYLSQLYETINNVGGVLNIVDLRVYNKVGGDYSLNEISQPYLDDETRQIDLLSQFTLFGEPNALTEIKNTAKDIKVKVRS